MGFKVELSQLNSTNSTLKTKKGLVEEPGPSNTWTVLQFLLIKIDFLKYLNQFLSNGIKAPILELWVLLS